ncbi:hemolysin III family protein, partial [Erwinia amylovora]|nr:hemolysin III family protein [Erwinia amylovora]
MLREKAVTTGYSLAEVVANSISHAVRSHLRIIGLVFIIRKELDSAADEHAIASYRLYGGTI